MCDITFGGKKVAKNWLARGEMREAGWRAERQEAGGKWWEWSQHLSTSPQDFALWTCNVEKRRHQVNKFKHRQMDQQ